MYSSIKKELIKYICVTFFHKCGATGTKKKSNISEVEVLAIPETLACTHKRVPSWPTKGKEWGIL